MSPGRAWSVLAILLLVTSVGVSSILNIILILILTIIASIIVFFVTLFAYTKVDKTPLCSRIAPRPPALQRRTSFVKKSRSVSPSMTGCEAMDKPLQDMISYILRDYVTSWYEKISSNPAFTGDKSQKFLHYLHYHYAEFHFGPSPPKWLFFGINQNKLTQGVKTYKKNKKNQKKFFLALPKFAVSNFRQSGPKIQIIMKSSH